jgi:hypothetical protein
LAEGLWSPTPADDDPSVISAWAHPVCGICCAAVRRWSLASASAPAPAPTVQALRRRTLGEDRATTVIGLVLLALVLAGAMVGWLVS